MESYTYKVSPLFVDLVERVVDRFTDLFFVLAASFLQMLIKVNMEFLAAIVSQLPSFNSVKDRSVVPWN